MSLKEIKNNIKNEFNEGESKSSLFKKYQNKEIQAGKTIKDSQLAEIISTLREEELVNKNKISNNILISIMFISMFLTISTQLISGVNIIFVLISLLIYAILIKGFIKVEYFAYNAYIILSMLGFSNLLKGMQEDFNTGIISLVIYILMFVFVWRLKSKLFPNMGFFGAKKNKNKEYLISK